MSKLKKILAMGLALTMVGGMLAGCGGSGNSGSDSNSGSGDTVKTLKFGCFDYSSSLNPASIINAAWCVTRFGIGECLFRFDDAMQAQPELCDKYEVSDDHKTWTFHIREGVKFSNGNDVTAEAVVASFERLYASEGSSEPSKFMNYESLKADNDAGTVTVVTKVAYADLTKNLAYPVFCILDASAEEDLETNPIGTGPYAIDEYQEKQGLKMSANKYYWNGEVPYDKVEISLINDDSTKAMAIKSGDIDLVENITSATEMEEIKKDTDTYKIATTSGIRCGFSYINESGVLGNDTLRQAILTALDNETMCKDVVGGMYTAGYSVLPSSLDYNYDKLTNPYEFNKEKAIKMLDDAGIKDTDGDGIREIDGKNIVLKHITYTNRNLADFAEAINLQLKDIGIETKIESSDAQTEWDKMVAGEYDLCSSNWTTVGTGDPTEYMANWYSKSNANYCNYKDEKFDELYEKLETELDESKRKEYITEMQQILIDDAAVMVHGYYNSVMVARADRVAEPVIHTADYYWLTTEIKPAQ